MPHTILEWEIIADLLLPGFVSEVHEDFVDRMLALADVVMGVSQEGDDDDANGEQGTPGHAAVRQTGDVELA